MPQHLSVYTNIYKIAMNWPLFLNRYFCFTLIYVKLKDQNILRKKGEAFKSRTYRKIHFGPVLGAKNLKIV